MGIGRAYGPLMNFEGAFPTFIIMMAKAISRDVSQRSVQITNPATGVPAAKSLGVAPVDLDEDGWIDLVIANDYRSELCFPQPTEWHL